MEAVQLTEESLYFSDITSAKTDGDNAEAESEILFINESKTEIIIGTSVSEAAENSIQSSVVPEHVHANKQKRELPKRSSISALFKEIHKEEAVEDFTNKVELTDGNVQSIWKDFLKENRDKLQNAFLSAAQNQSPELIEDRVTFTASNNVSLEMLQLHKMDITTYFRKRTTSITVVPDFKLQRDESQVKSYKTAKDRLKDMIDSNAAVLKLIEKFDLNID